MAHAARRLPQERQSVTYIITFTDVHELADFSFYRNNKGYFHAHLGF